MKRSQSRMRKWGIVLAAAMLGGGLALGLRTEAQDAAAPADDGPAIEATAHGTAAAQLRTMDDIRAADRARSAQAVPASAPRPLPTGDLQEYRAAKAAADASSASTRAAAGAR